VNYVLDANAVLRYFAVREGQGINRVRAHFEQAERGQARLSMSVVNLVWCLDNVIIFPQPHLAPKTGLLCFGKTLFCCDADSSSESNSRIHRCFCPASNPAPQFHHFPGC
jgi:hypothetical protein